jgi:hypothetical protein
MINKIQIPSFSDANRPFGQVGEPSLFDGYFYYENLLKVQNSKA